jgi:hypothetical protein
MRAGKSRGTGVITDVSSGLTSILQQRSVRHETTRKMNRNFIFGCWCPMTTNVINSLGSLLFLLKDQTRNEEEPGNVVFLRQEMIVSEVTSERDKRRQN